MLDRTEASRAIAKIISNHDVGKTDEAKRWAAILYRMLRDEGLLD